MERTHVRWLSIYMYQADKCNINHATTGYYLLNILEIP